MRVLVEMVRNDINWYFFRQLGVWLLEPPPELVSGGLTVTWPHSRGFIFTLLSLWL